MPADTDHIRRDALHAARSEVRILASKYIRRLDAAAKAHIDSALVDLDGVVDGTSIGREAAQAAIDDYVADTAVGGGSVEALESGGDPDSDSAHA